MYIADYLVKKHPALLDAISVIKMPDLPSICVCIQEKPSTIEIPPQINAEVHYITIQVRHTNYEDAFALAYLLAGYMQTSDIDFPTKSISEIDTTGIVSLTESVSVCSNLIRTPHAIDTDNATQQELRTVQFLCKIISSKF